MLASGNWDEIIILWNWNIGQNPISKRPDRFNNPMNIASVTD
ncbi:hypothetical protein [Nostoc sp.]